MVLKLFTTFIVVAAILVSPKHRDFTWSYRSSIYRVHWSILTHKVTGDDSISAKLLKIAASAIAGSISGVINHCFDTQIFPVKWKIARVTPIFKGNGSRDDKNNYRPISVLPILSQIFEKHVCDNVHSFLKENSIHHRLQSGFRKFHSTETALVRLVDQLLIDLDNNRVSGLIFVNCKKGFDLIDHQLLLQKLEIYGAQRNELKLLRNYRSAFSMSKLTEIVRLRKG